MKVKGNFVLIAVRGLFEGAYYNTHMGARFIRGRILNKGAD